MLSVFGNTIYRSLNEPRFVWEILSDPGSVIDHPISTVSESLYWVIGIDNKGLLAVPLSDTYGVKSMEPVTIPRDARVVNEYQPRILALYGETIDQIQNKFKLGKYSNGIAAD